MEARRPRARDDSFAARTAAASAPRQHAAHLRHQARGDVTLVGDDLRPDRGGNPMASGGKRDEDRVARTRVALGRMVRAAAAPGVRSDSPGVAILQVDTDRRLGTIDRNIYGQFLEEINHSAVDGLFAEQIRGAGFEGTRLRDLLDALRAAGCRAPRRGSVRAWHEERAAYRRPSVRRASGSGASFSSPAGPMTDRSGSRSSRARRVCHCACWRRMEACWRIFRFRRADRRGRKCPSRSRARGPIATRRSRSPPPDAARRSSTSSR